MCRDEFFIDFGRMHLWCLFGSYKDFYFYLYNIFCIVKGHNSIWFSKVRGYLSFVKEDIFIRQFIMGKLFDAGISQIEIKRKLDFLELNIFAAKPSLILGSNGSKVFDLRKELEEELQRAFSHRTVNLSVIEIINPDSNSRFLAEFVRQQLEKRVPFRRVVKSAILRAQKAGVKGVKIQVSGRLNGAEIARTEWVREGQVPLHTLKANIDYCDYKAR